MQGGARGSTTCLLPTWLPLEMRVWSRLKGVTLQTLAGQGRLWEEPRPGTVNPGVVGRGNRVLILVGVSGKEKMGQEDETTNVLYSIHQSSGAAYGCISSFHDILCSMLYLVCGNRRGTHIHTYVGLSTVQLDFLQMLDYPIPPGGAYAMSLWYPTICGNESIVYNIKWMCLSPTAHTHVLCTLKTTI